MGIFNKILSGITYPGRAVVGTGGKMKRWFTSKTIGVAALALFTKLFAMFMSDVEVLDYLDSNIGWAVPFLMVLLRIVTKGPITK